MDTDSIRARVAEARKQTETAYATYCYESKKREWRQQHNETETYRLWMNLVSVSSALEELLAAQLKLAYELRRTKIRL